jgi:hypothetical protein
MNPLDHINARLDNIESHLKDIVDFQPAPAQPAPPADGTWQHYKRKGLSEMRPYQSGEDLAHVSISGPDRQASSPKEGDMIARNPKNHADQWLVAKKYFDDNLEPAEKSQSDGAALDKIAHEITKFTADRDRHLFAPGEIEAAAAKLATPKPADTLAADGPSEKQVSDALGMIHANIRVGVTLDSQDVDDVMVIVDALKAKEQQTSARLKELQDKLADTEKAFQREAGSALSWQASSVKTTQESHKTIEDLTERLKEAKAECASLVMQASRNAAEQAVAKERKAILKMWTDFGPSVATMPAVANVLESEDYDVTASFIRDLHARLANPASAEKGAL